MPLPRELGAGDASLISGSLDPLQGGGVQVTDPPGPMSTKRVDPLWACRPKWQPHAFSQHRSDWIADLNSAPHPPIVIRGMVAIPVH